MKFRTTTQKLISKFGVRSEIIWHGLFISARPVIVTSPVLPISMQELLHNRNHLSVVHISHLRNHNSVAGAEEVVDMRGGGGLG